MRQPIYILITICLLFIGCEKKKETNWTLQKSKLKRSFFETQKAIASKVNQKGNSYINDVKFFENLPAQYALEYCRKTWKSWYNEFLLLSPYRYFSNSLDAGFKENQNFYDLSSINYSYVDYSASQPNSGIIKDVSNYPQINQVGMISWHQSGGENNASLGFHVLEFLLWGEDLSSTSPGQRTNNDYIQNSTENERRMEYLVDASKYLNLIINDLNYSPSYESKILAMDIDEAFTSILNGYLRFIDEDLIEKTLSKPLESLDPRDELSDFSDNTLANIRSKINGLRYAFDGSSLFFESDETRYFMIDFINDVNKESAQKINASLDQIDALLSGIDTDFEQALQDVTKREKLDDVILELEKIYSLLENIKLEYSA